MANLVPVSPLPSPSEFQMLKDLAVILFNSGLVPSSVKTKEAALIIMLKGRELGIPPIEALSGISVINGKPAMDSQLMLSRILQRIPGADIHYVTTTNSECVVEACRPGGKPSRFSFTMADAERAGLLKNPSWTKYPQAMLRARTIAIIARALFPDALSSVVHTPEELGAEVDDEGNVVDSKSETREVSPPAEQPAPPAITGTTTQTNEYRINFGKKYPNMTFAEAIARDGLDEVRDWVKLIKTEKDKPVTAVPRVDATFAVVNFEREFGEVPRD